MQSQPGPQVPGLSRKFRGRAGARPKSGPASRSRGYSPPALPGEDVPQDVWGKVSLEGLSKQDPRGRPSMATTYAPATLNARSWFDKVELTYVPVSACGMSTGFDSGDRRWRSQMESRCKPGQRLGAIPGGLSAALQPALAAHLLSPMCPLRGNIGIIPAPAGDRKLVVKGPLKRRKTSMTTRSRAAGGSRKSLQNKDLICWIVLGSVQNSVRVAGL